MKIYRIEHPSDGYGPYTTYHNYDDKGMRTNHCDQSGHPNPYVDLKLAYFEKSFHCGFNSQENLEKWFHGYLDNLGHKGFQMVIYEGPAYKVSQRTGQTLFDRSISSLVKRIDICVLMGENQVKKEEDISSKFGKGVMRLGKSWQGSGMPDAKEREEAYFAEREQAYQRICAAYNKQGFPSPSPKILSGE